MGQILKRNTSAESAECVQFKSEVEERLESKEFNKFVSSLVQPFSSELARILHSKSFSSCKNLKKALLLTKEQFSKLETLCSFGYCLTNDALQVTKQFKLLQSLSDLSQNLIETSLKLQIAAIITKLKATLVSLLIQSRDEKPSQVATLIVNEVLSTYVKELNLLSASDFAPVLA